jgi:hypothetical protein
MPRFSPVNAIWFDCNVTFVPAEKRLPHRRPALQEMPEVAVPRELIGELLRRIDGLRPKPAPKAYANESTKIVCVCRTLFDLQQNQIRSYPTIWSIKVRGGNDAEDWFDTDSCGRADRGGTVADRLQAAPIGPPEGLRAALGSLDITKRHKSSFGRGGDIVGTMTVGTGRAFTGAAMPGGTA